MSQSNAEMPQVTGQAEPSEMAPAERAPIEQFSNDVIVRKLDELAERLARLENVMAQHHEISAQWLEEVAALVTARNEAPAAPPPVELREPVASTPVPPVEPRVSQPSPTSLSRRRGFDDNNHKPEPRADEASPTRLDEAVTESVPEIKFPDAAEKDWNEWVEAWVQAEHRAAVLGAQVPQVSGLLFAPGGGQDILDTWKSLWTGREAVVEASRHDDSQIKHLATLTLARYEREMEPLRRQSPWHAVSKRLIESLTALGAVATGDVQAAVTKCDSDVASWQQFMDREAGWFVQGQGYMEAVAMSLAALFDKLSDRPGGQTQFQIETKADMTIYTTLRAAESFLAQMNVQRDKEVAIGRHLDPVARPRADELVKKSPVPGVAKTPVPPPPTRRISRVIRNRWVLMGENGRELSELVKANYELG